MRDIIRRIRRHRLSRYASPNESLGRRTRWLWPVILVWLVYAGMLSDHGLVRIWRLRREQARTQLELAKVRAEIERLDREGRDPAARRRIAEKSLRERSGWARPGEIIYRIEGDAGDSTRR